MRGFVVQPACRPSRGSFALGMVRNIDLPEAVMLYGAHVCIHPSLSDSLRGGLGPLLDDCWADETVVFALLEEEQAKPAQNLLPDYCHIHIQSVSPPNPEDLLQALTSVPDFQPKPFGGSAGFGTRQTLDPLRSPLPARTVVLTHTLEQTRAARCAGMRAIRVDGADDDDLADFVLMDDEIDFTVDDIATPGSFWLNPPHPRDDQGNHVDPFQVVQIMNESVKNVATDATAAVAPEPDDEDELLRLLADIDPL